MIGVLIFGKYGTMKATRSRGPDLSKGAGGTTQAPCASRLQAIDSVTAAIHWPASYCRDIVRILGINVHHLGPGPGDHPRPGWGNGVLIL